MKNKKIVILGASLVMTLTISVAVTDRVNGREEGKPKTLWMQMAEKAMETLGIPDARPMTDSAIMPEEFTKTTEKRAEAPESVTSGKASDTSEAVSDSRSSDSVLVQSGTPVPGTLETPVTEESKAPEAILPETAVPPTEASAPKTDLGPAADAQATEAAANLEVSGPAIAPAPATKPQATAPAPARASQPEAQAYAEKDPQAALKTEPVTVSKGTILQMSTAAENSTTKLHYNYAEDLGDGRGITFGIIGFTTGTYDGNELIRHYTALNKDNSLARYLPVLDAIDSMPHTGNEDDASDSTEGLEGFLEAIQDNSDPMFRQAQLDKLDERYWNPAVKLQVTIGAKNPLTQAFLYDMTVNHGQDGAQNLIRKAEYALGGTPGTGVDENVYLMKLMDLRETYLNNTGNPGADRVAAFRRILDTGNVTLDTPFSFTVYGDTFRIDGNIE